MGYTKTDQILDMCDGELDEAVRFRDYLNCIIEDAEQYELK